MRLKLHISPCPNDTFMFDALVNGRIDTGSLRFEVEYHDIEELNRGAGLGRADISKISCAVLPAIAEHYALLDSGAALGRGNGPLLVRRAGDTRPIRRVAVPGLHTTANALMGKLFPEIEERTPLLFSRIAAAVERGDFDAGVLIHEGRFVYRERELELVADLGQLWEHRTALPLPLGGIAARRSLPDEVRHEAERLLRTSIEYAFTHPEASRTYIKQHAQELDDKVIDAHIALFVNGYSLSLGDEGRRAIEALTGGDPLSNRRPPPTRSVMKSVLLLFPLLIAAIRATGEAPLWQAANGSRVRFLGLRTFDNPVVVGMEKNGNKTTLRRKTAGGAGGYEPGKIAADESKALGRQAWLEYMARLQKAGCRQMDTTDKGLMGFDGSQWIPGVNPNGQYLVIDRWRGCGIRELCLPLFRLT